MNELIAKIKELNAALVADAELQVAKGNKAAGTRARKASLELEKVLKEFRKVSGRVKEIIFFHFVHKRLYHFVQTM